MLAAGSNDKTTESLTANIYRQFWIKSSQSNARFVLINNNLKKLQIKSLDDNKTVSVNILLIN